MTIVAVHTHSWVIESPAPGKRVLWGTCGCGAERSFTGGIDEDLAAFDKGASMRSAVWKAAATLRILDGEDIADIAAGLGKSERAVKAVRTRLKEKLGRQA